MSYDIGPDGNPERDALIARLKGALVGGRVYDDLPDATNLEKGPNGEILPYIFTAFSSPSPESGSRTVSSTELEQPYWMGFSVECWAPTMNAARRTAGAVRRILPGWAPSESSAPIELLGGGQFTSRTTNVMPTRAMEQVRGRFLFNLGVSLGVPDTGIHIIDNGDGTFTIEGVEPSPDGTVTL